MAKVPVLTVVVYDDLSAGIEKSEAPVWNLTNWRLTVVTDEGTNLEFSGVEKTGEEPPS